MTPIFYPNISIYTVEKIWLPQIRHMTKVTLRVNFTPKVYFYHNVHNQWYHRSPRFPSQGVSINAVVPPRLHKEPIFGRAINMH